RIEEFFEGLATTDFFVVYGLFSAGAHVGNVAYSKYLDKYIKPKFVSGILRTNLVLATGMALPEIYHGTFNGKAFAINLAGLGLSTTAVKAGVASLKWVTNLGGVDRTGRMAAKLAKFRSFAKVGGWFYTAAETAVVLYFGEEISAAVNKYLDDKAAKNAVADASVDFFKAVSDKGMSDEKFAEALDKFNGSHVDYRNYLYKPLAMDEQIYYARLTKAARKAKILEDKRKTRLEKLEKYPALKATVLRRYGTLEKYADHLAREDEKELDAQVATYLESYNLNREAHLKEVYEGNKRGGSYLNTEHALWVANGAKAGAPGDPYRGRNDYFARSGREGLVSDFREAAFGISKNRIEAYSDQEAALRLALKTTDDPEKKKLIGELISALGEIKDKDAKLGSVTSDGAVGALRGQR
ncbi:MAG: hypothetical protein P1V97_37430, partial [Planctomycetota bacterium]|nr:hypothetical protein [Planctomycetota bacterium]